MMTPFRRRVLVWGMFILGVGMIVIGAFGGLVPPALTGVGFLLLAWAHGGWKPSARGEC